jgi:Fe-S cluster assembly protein SufD
MSALQAAVEAAPGVSRLHQRASFDPTEFGVVTGREEEWRFTPLRRMRGLAGDGPFTDGKVAVDVDAAPEVRVDHREREFPRRPGSMIPSDRVSATAFARAREETVMSVAPGIVASRPTLVSVAGKDAGATAFGHLRLEVGEGASAVFVLDHTGSVTLADNVEITVGDNASLTVLSLQDWAADSVHLSHHHATVGPDARFRHIAVSLGGGVVRLAPSVRFAGPGADAELLGLYYADDGQHLEHRLFVDHCQPRCRSRVEYKGALQGARARTVWIGDVLIRPEAVGTDTYETNRNLLLTDGARADSVPNLEILTGEVAGAGHASASGRLEDDHLFYLMARGIPLVEARRLAIRGFFAALIAKIDDAGMRERITASIEAELAGVGQV